MEQEATRRAEPLSEPLHLFLEGPFFFKQSGPAFNLGFFEVMLHNGAVALPALPRLLPAPPLPHRLLPAESW